MYIFNCATSVIGIPNLNQVLEPTDDLIRDSAKTYLVAAFQMASISNVDTIEMKLRIVTCQFHARTVTHYPINGRLKSICQINHNIKF